MQTVYVSWIGSRHPQAPNARLFACAVRWRNTKGSEIFEAIPCQVHYYSIIAEVRSKKNYTAAQQVTHICIMSYFFFTVARGTLDQESLLAFGSHFRPVVVRPNHIDLWYSVMPLVLSTSIQVVQATLVREKIPSFSKVGGQHKNPVVLASLFRVRFRPHSKHRSLNSPMKTGQSATGSVMIIVTVWQIWPWLQLRTVSTSKPADGLASLTLLLCTIVVRCFTFFVCTPSSTTTTRNVFYSDVVWRYGGDFNTTRNVFYGDLARPHGADSFVPIFHAISYTILRLDVQNNRIFGFTAAAVATPQLQAIIRRVRFSISQFLI